MPSPVTGRIEALTGHGRGPVDGRVPGLSSSGPIGARIKNVFVFLGQVLGICALGSKKKTDCAQPKWEYKMRIYKLLRSSKVPSSAFRSYLACSLCKTKSELGPTWEVLRTGFGRIEIIDLSPSQNHFTWHFSFRKKWKKAQVPRSRFGRTRSISPPPPKKKSAQ